MRRVFVDAQYWVAILHEKDQSHAAAEVISQSLKGETRLEMAVSTGPTKLSLTRPASTGFMNPIPS
jgi:hypothetical protein